MDEELKIAHRNYLTDRDNLVYKQILEHAVCKRGLPLCQFDLAKHEVEGYDKYRGCFHFEKAFCLHCNFKWEQCDVVHPENGRCVNPIGHGDPKIWIDAWHKSPDGGWLLGRLRGWSVPEDENRYKKKGN